MTPTGVGSPPQAQWEVQPVAIATRSETEEVPLMTSDEQSGRAEPEQNTEQASNTDATERAKEQMREALNRKEDADHRSEERRVGKEWRARKGQDDERRRSNGKTCE